MKIMDVFMAGKTFIKKNIHNLAIMLNRFSRTERPSPPPQLPQSCPRLVKTLYFAGVSPAVVSGVGLSVRRGGRLQLSPAHSLFSAPSAPCR